MSQSVYLTDLQPQPKHSSLHHYVDKLDSKIDYAKWKQSLVLSYNYMPLQSIKQKIQLEHKTYSKKMDEEESKLRKTVESKEVIEQLELFREFSSKLASKMKEIEFKINQQRMKIKVLSTEAEDKKARLKEVLKENMNLTKVFYNQQGINTKQDLLRLSRANSIRGPMTTRTVRDQKTKSTLTNYDNMATIRNARSSYDECLQSIVKSLRGMNTSEDVQTGIYLDIMSKKTQDAIPKPKYSTKSNICHTLMDRYGSLNTHHKRENEDFQMSWETFNQLNWKQIMGVVLVKDPKVASLKHLLQAQ